MTLKAIVHPAKEGGFWAEVPALPGCVTQGETLGEVEANLREAVEGVYRRRSPDKSGRPHCRGRRVKQVSGQDLARAIPRKAGPWPRSMAVTTYL
ncbi:MAG TPA: type II toxin-antitoxin system HicB family antitoxin [Chthoniobacterales bacterium]